MIVLAIVVAFLFFGWKQLPDMARSLGRSLRVFKTEVKGMSADDKAREDANQASQEPAAIEAPKVTRIDPEPRVTQPRQPVAASRPRPAPRQDAQAPADRPDSPS
ncbi:Sec-independent protein translocase subunit TatA [uncultured Jatrophihabitans sp.]|uniref:Sec-independent protein translocase subunit TatA n=1 Tax=uncultured Jatrophihabitans sp. TaxID=1610747 RepID=UPI0035CB92F1